MNAKHLLIPVLIIAAGVTTYFVAPLDPRLRLLILGSDIFAALLIGLLLWRQAGR